MPGQTKVHIAPDGKVTSETTGVSGSGCEAKMQAYLDKLGIKLEDTKHERTPEYYLEEEVLEQEGE